MVQSSLNSTCYNVYDIIYDIMINTKTDASDDKRY